VRIEITILTLLSPPSAGYITEIKKNHLLNLLTPVTHDYRHLESSQ